MASHKNQHFIPRYYLKAWCDLLTPSKQTPYVWQFSKDGTQAKKKSPENIFYEKDIYTITEDNGSRNLVFENNLSKLENQFSLTHTNFILSTTVMFRLTKNLRMTQIELQGFIVTSFSL